MRFTVRGHAVFNNYIFILKNLDICLEGGDTEVRRNLLRTSGVTGKKRKNNLYYKCIFIYTVVICVKKVKKAKRSILVRMSHGKSASAHKKSFIGLLEYILRKIITYIYLELSKYYHIRSYKYI